MPKPFNTLLTAEQMMSLADLCGTLHEHLPSAPVVQYADKTHIKLLGGINYFVGTGRAYVVADQTVDIATALDTGSITAGTDYYVYLTTEATVVISASATLPTGTLSDGTTAYSANNTRKLGGFHTICRTIAADVIESPTSVFVNKLHPLAGWTAGDVLPLSVWAINFRPCCPDPSGMVFSAACNIWVDIYNSSGTIAAPQSKFGGTRLCEYSQTEFLTGLANVGKRLLSDDEFWFVSVGSNCNTKVAGEAQPNPDTTGGHNDTVGYPMISEIGCEECCGLQNQWLRDNYMVSQNAGSWDNGSTYATKAFDGGNNSFGSMFYMQYFRASGAGGSWTTSSLPALGPLFRYTSYSRSSRVVAIGARGSSPHTSIPLNVI